MKKLINSPETVVTEALEGVAAAHPSLSVDVENKVITRAGGPTPGKVGLVSGGGSGHEPLHGGFVGYGMLDAACPGEVFTSPVPDQMLAATQAVNGGAGVLHVVKNYTGDVLNFQMAAEMAGDEGIEVIPVVINDDVAVQDSLYTAGRRGTGATVFVEKIAGALADSVGAPSATPPFLDAERRACERQARSGLGEEAFELAFEDGLGMSLDDAVAYALKQSAETSPPAAAPADPPRALPAESTAVGSLSRSLAVEGRGAGTVSVLIVDRHRVVADGIQMLLEQHPDLQVVGIATSAGDAVALASDTRPDVIVADYQLPDMTGAELAARLRDEQATTHILLLSSVVSNALLREAVKAGARGVLLKTQPAEQLVDAVRRVGAGEMLIPATSLADFITGSDKDAQLFDLLTGREREVLRQLAAGLDNRHIAAQMGIGYVTVRSHLRNLSSKLDAHSRLEILARAAELGLIVR